MNAKPRMGRPPKKDEDRRTSRLEIRLSPKELEQLLASAPDNVSTWARDVLLRAAKRR